MSKTTAHRAVLLTLTLILSLLACSGPAKRSTSTPRDLLVAGKYEAARKAASRGSDISTRDRAVIALSHLAQAPGEEGARRAAEALSKETSPVAVEVAATEMLELVQLVPPSENADFELLAARAALGAIGEGDLAISSMTATSGTEASKILAISVLEQLTLWASVGDRAPDSARLLEVWNGAYILLGGTFAVQSDALAWRLYVSVGNLAVLMDQIAAGSELSRVLLRSAVTAVEENDSIAIAVRCDLASPFDRLRPAVSRDRELLGRLEWAVATATGCSRGKYAPTGD